MPFRPDIIVTDPDSGRILLIVEAKTGSENLREVEPQLKRYMVQMKTPLGLVATPSNLKLYKDRYIGHGQDSVQLVGSYPAPPPWSSWRSGQEFEFENAVRFWLNDILSSGVVSDVSPETEEALNSYLVPFLSGGVIRGTGLRESRGR